jgi:glycosyltransferase involved in cell wall biosynthesis
MKSPQIDVTVIIATYNRCRSLEQTLRSLARQQVAGGFTWEAIVVDNNSSDGTRGVVESLPETQRGRFRYVFEGRQGKTYALNTAIAQARGEILAFTDDDVTLDPAWLMTLVTRVRDGRCAGAGGRIVPVWTDPKPRWLETEGPYRLGAVIVSLDLGPHPCFFSDLLPLGANLAIRADVLERLGAFRTDLGPTVGSQIRGEDSEICERLLGAGERLLYVPDAIVYHPVAKDRLRRRYFQDYYYAQGRAVTRYEGVPADATAYWGVPRYLLWAAGVRLARWMASCEVKRRFYHKLQFYYAVGRIAEARTLLAGNRSVAGAGASGPSRGTVGCHE